MKAIIILSLISCSLIFTYWYLEIANDHQKQFVKDKASAAGQSIASKSKEVYDNRGEYFDAAKEISQKAGQIAKNVASKSGEIAKEAWDDLAKKGSTSETTSEYFESHFYAGKPKNISYPNKIKILENEGFIVGYDDERKNPAWVCYRLFEDTIEKGPKRPSRFSVDHRTRAKLSHDDYTNSGFDRGHMAPNYAIALRYGTDAQKETFLMSNIVPQKPALNQGPWRELEEEIGTEWANENKIVWVITGPIYYKNKKGSILGLTVPDAFFKVLIDELPGGEVRMLAYIMSQDVGRRDDFQDYAVSVDEVEEKSGFDFFTDLKDASEDLVEAEVNRSW